MRKVSKGVLFLLVLIVLVVVLVLGSKTRRRVLAGERSMHFGLFRLCEFDISEAEARIKAFLKKTDEVKSAAAQETKTELVQIQELIDAPGARDILARITQAEAGDGTLEQKKNVVSCVINRAMSDDWPETVEKVVFQKGQFSPITDGGYKKAKVSQTSYDAVEAVYSSGVTHDCMFFCSYGCKSKYFAAKGEPDMKDGIHRYYKK